MPYAVERNMMNDARADNKRGSSPIGSARCVSAALAILFAGIGAIVTSSPCFGVTPGGHYFQYQGKPLILVSSDQHYGAAINSEFDYAAYLRYLGSRGMNVTRI